jgi:predicted kinase
MMTKLYLPVGMIGSGKSTWAREFIKTTPNTYIIAGDDIRFMLNGGIYEHDPELESAIKEMLFNSTRALLKGKHNVILDECYCSLSKDMRKEVALTLGDTIDALDTIAVVFPERGMQDRIEDKVMKGLRGKTVAYWKRVFREMLEDYEPFNRDKEYYFDSVIEVK